MSFPLQIPHSTQEDVERFRMKVFGNNNVKAVLHRLDRLTFDEALLTAAQILEVVRELVENLRNTMSGEQVLFNLSYAPCQTSIFSRRRDQNRRHPEGTRYVSFQSNKATA